MFRYWVLVGFTTQRPVIPDQHRSLVTCMADTDREAFNIAFEMVYGRKGVEMITRCEIIQVEL